MPLGNGPRVAVRSTTSCISEDCQDEPTWNYDVQGDSRSSRSLGARSRQRAIRCLPQATAHPGNNDSSMLAVAHIITRSRTPRLYSKGSSPWRQRLSTKQVLQARHRPNLIADVVRTTAARRLVFQALGASLPISGGIARDCFSIPWTLRARAPTKGGRRGKSSGGWPSLSPHLLGCPISAPPECSIRLVPQPQWRCRTRRGTDCRVPGGPDCGIDGRRER